MIVSAGLKFFWRSFRWCAARGLDVAFGRPDIPRDYVYAHERGANVQHYSTDDDDPKWGGSE